MSIEAVSRALRHASTETTEAFYARIRADDAFHESEKAFDEPEVWARRGVAENRRSATALHGNAQREIRTPDGRCSASGRRC